MTKKELKKQLFYSLSVLLIKHFRHFFWSLSKKSLGFERRDPTAIMYVTNDTT